MVGGLVRRFAVVAVLAVAVGTIGCRPVVPPACDLPDRGALTANSSNRLNPDEFGRPLPTIVRVYQLANVGPLELATFDEMWTNDEETLGDAMMAKDEFTLYPETEANRQFERNPDANFIVAMGVFRRPQGTSWRSIMTLPPPASEVQCAERSMQDDPSETPEVPPMARVDLLLDGYRIEGTLTLVPIDAEEDCPPWNVACQAAEQAEAARDEAVNQVEAPSTPAAPEAPAAPTAPEAPAPGGT